MATPQATIETKDDGTLLIKDATEGITVQDSQGYNTSIKETVTGLELTVFDGAQVPTVYEIVGGKLKNILEIKAKVNGVDDTTISDELAAANYYVKEGEVIKSGGNYYFAITVDADPAGKEYTVNLNDLGRLTMEGQISDVVNAALTAELEKLGRYDWTTEERIGYLDTTSKVVEVLWAKMDTENKKYIVNCGALS